MNYFTKLSLLALVSSHAFIPLAGQVYINEISVCNISKELDPDKDYSGWIELYNSSSSSVNIRDLYFSDDREAPYKYRLSVSRTIPANGFAVVWLNDEVNNSDTGYALDANQDDGGLFMISDKNGELLDVLEYPVQYPNISYGRTKDGDPSAPTAYFIQSTFEASNNGMATADSPVEAPVFSVSSGFYSNSVTVEISCATEGARIYYTTDFSEPTQESALYTGKLTFDHTTVLRAKAFKEGFLEGVPSTSTFMINERIPDLPVVFVTLDPESLFGDELGIYAVGKEESQPNYKQNWTRAGNFEFLDGAEKTPILNQLAGFAISGQGSRSFEQKSFKVKARAKYGVKRLNHQFFPQREGRRYKSILLRSGGQYYVGLALVRDAVLQELAGVTPLPYQGYKPSVVYLNGSYWGIYNLRERNSQDNLYSNYGLKKDEIDLVNNGYLTVASVGSLSKYKELEAFIYGADLSNTSDYQKLCEMIDIDNYLYYMACEIGLDNDDWPDNNQKLFLAHVGENQKWRWILQDLDNTLKRSSYDCLGKLFDSSSTKLSTKMICYLLNNKEFEGRYIDVQSLVTGSVYSPQRVEERMSQALNHIRSEYPYAREKWTEQLKRDPDKEVNLMVTNLKGLHESAYTNLCTRFSLGTVYELTILSNHSNIKIGFNQEVIPVLPYTGKYFSERELTLTAPLYDQEEMFAYWEIDNGSHVTKVEGLSLRLKQSDNIQVKAVYEPVEKSRRSGLYINEVSAANGIFVDNHYKVEDWIEIYNSAGWPIDLAGCYLSNSRTDEKLFQFPENSEETIVPALGRVIVWCSNKTERGPLHANFKLKKDGGYLSLSKPMDDGSTLWMDSIAYTAHDEYVSFGRYPDGAETVVLFDYPTFCAPNQHSTYNTVSYVEKYDLVTEVTAPSAGTKSDVYIYQDRERSSLFVENCEHARYTLLTIDGTILQEGNWNSGQSIDIRRLENGVYLIVLVSENQKQTFRFVK